MKNQALADIVPSRSADHADLLPFIAHHHEARSTTHNRHAIRPKTTHRLPLFFD
jgi:hypothetical protein